MQERRLAADLPALARLRASLRSRLAASPLMDDAGFTRDLERLYREAPMLMIGEGTADIQRMIIARRLLEDYKSRG